jgi:hypothetical protein
MEVGEEADLRRLNVRRWRRKVEGGGQEIRCNFARRLRNGGKEVVTGARLCKVINVYVCGNIQQLMVYL